MPTLTRVTLELPDVSGLAGCSDQELTELVSAWGEARRIVDAGIAQAAGEVARRSALELGYDGLAQRTGERTADGLISKLTGTSVPEARSMVSVGSMLADPAPWLAEVAALVGEGKVSVGAAAAIEKGLGSPSASVAADDLLDAATVLIEQAQNHTPEQVGRLARDLRDELDAEHVTDREAHRRSKRFLKLIPQADGMTRITGLADPESAAILKAAIDPITSPRRGGPRFVDPHDQARAEAIIDDPRTTDQLTHDAFVELVRIGAAADDGRLYGSRKPSLRMHASLAELEARRRAAADGCDPAQVGGIAWIEGETASVSLATAERFACADGYYPLVFDENGDGMRLGRSQRNFSEKQRIMLAAIWGGCAVEGCDRPPSWTEAHHIDEWLRHHGETNIDRGILLCRHHHLLVHARGWRILRHGNEYTVIGPVGNNETVPIRLVSKNPIRRRS